MPLCGLLVELGEILLRKAIGDNDNLLRFYANLN
jgi:HD-like signal output (HDOD) protein